MLTTSVLTMMELQQVMAFESSLTDGEICLKSDYDDIRNGIIGGCSFGVFDNDKLVAYTIAVWNEYGVGYIDKCFVSEEYRGKGLQRLMLTRSMEALLKKNVHEVFAMCSPKNTVSLRNFMTQRFSVVRNIEYEGRERLLLKFYI